MRAAFHKMHGAGNDFVVIDGRNGARALTGAEAVRLADRRTGIGCDQMVLLEAADPADADVRARYLNPDGSESAACGNALRCIALLLSGGRPGAVVRVRTGAGVSRAQVLERGLVSAEMGAPLLGWREVPLAEAADTLHLPIPGGPAACSMGNPHATLFAAAGADLPDPAVAGPLLERHPLFPERANVGFARVLAPDRIRLRVWERGAGLTRACGTGACAAVVNAARRGLTGRRVAVELDGGRLEVEWEAGGGVRMTGPAVHVFEGRVELGPPPPPGAAAGGGGGGGGGSGGGGDRGMA